MDEETQAGSSRQGAPPGALPSSAGEFLVDFHDARRVHDIMGLERRQDGSFQNNLEPVCVGQHINCCAIWSTCNSFFSQSLSVGEDVQASRRWDSAKPSHKILHSRKHLLSPICPTKLSDFPRFSRNLYNVTQAQVAAWIRKYRVRG